LTELIWTIGVPSPMLGSGSLRRRGGHGARLADRELAAQLAEIGVILLMFGVGLHFSINDLQAIRRIAVPGALGQIAVATAIGAATAFAWGWSFGAGLVFGLALSVASTVVLLRALEERNALETDKGRIAVGWLIVEDLAMVLALVLLPAFGAPLGSDIAGADARHGLLLTIARLSGARNRFAARRSFGHIRISNRLRKAGGADGSFPGSSLRRSLPLVDLQVVCRQLAPLGDDLEGQFLAFRKTGVSCALDGRDMDENVRGSIAWLNKTIAAIHVEEFYRAACHDRLLGAK
jgi:hypothetical protein